MEIFIMLKNFFIQFLIMQMNNNGSEYLLFCFYKQKQKRIEKLPKTLKRN